MSYRIIVDPFACIDIHQSIDWYNKAQAKLGNRFYDHVKSTIKKIEHTWIIQHL